MSIVIAYKKGDTVYMGADSKRSQGDFTTSLDSKYEKKIRKIGSNMLIGGVGLVTCIQTMIDNSDEWFNTKGKPLTKKFIVQNVIPKFFETLRKDNKIKIEDGKETVSKSVFCVTDGKKIFLIDDYFLVSECTEYCAIGCSEDIAYSHLRYADKEKHPNEIILGALRGSVYRDSGVGAPYILIDTEKFEFTDVEK